MHEEIEAAPFFVMRSKTASICPATRRPAASQSARQFAGKRLDKFLSLIVEIGHGQSAPSARNALAQPQAIDWSLAMPTMRPVCPPAAAPAHGALGLI